MNTKVLKTFLTICRVGSITKAAQLLYISQPALSRQIQDLEEELGCKLFDRSKRQLALTESGFLLQQRAQEILNLDERTKKELRENAGFLSGELRIGCVESSAVRFLADKFQAFRATFPQVQFELYSATATIFAVRLITIASTWASFWNPLKRPNTTPSIYRSPTAGASWFAKTTSSLQKPLPTAKQSPLFA